MVTNKDYNVYSTDKNFVIFVVDAVDSVLFEKVMNNNPQYQDTFKNFTYYPDTISPYLFTRDTIPFIISGIWNENKTNFLDYHDKAFSESILLDNLNERNYKINIYDSEIIGKSVFELNASNIKSNFYVNMIEFVKQEVKYILFKYLPYSLKQYSKIETMNFNVCKMDINDGIFDWDDKKNYDLINQDIVKTDKKVFKFFHIEGGHVPFNYDENLNIVESGTYEQKMTATLKIINSYINKLKSANVYDNSVIMIMADHGYDYANVIGRQNPILFIKGVGEQHEIYRSDKPISFEDFNEAYLNLLDGKTSVDLFRNIDINRERRFLHYEYTKEDFMTEYVQTGKAWDESTIKETGKKFNR